MSLSIPRVLVFGSNILIVWACCCVAWGKTEWSDFVAIGGGCRTISIRVGNQPQVTPHSQPLLRKRELELENPTCREVRALTISFNSAYIGKTLPSGSARTHLGNNGFASGVNELVTCSDDLEAITAICGFRFHEQHFAPRIPRWSLEQSAIEFRYQPSYLLGGYNKIRRNLFLYVVVEDDDL
ncbi:hypothetical protein Tco_0820628 [Tanacetum coccineum]|uniref:Uncharacterized protein n=1 Tax=Tanacetum coccineum TaxID=301880 RepID=A0ABQ5AE92_9ASTR